MRFLTSGVIVVLSACLGCQPQSAAAAGDVTGAVKSSDLVGSSWLVRGIAGGSGEMVDVSPEATLDATFDEAGTVAGSSGCNRYTAGYEIDGAEITISQAASTQKMCVDDRVMEREAAFLAALADVARWKISGERLELRRADGTPVLEMVSAITGSVTYRTRKALPPTAKVEVSLQDVSRADAPSEVIGTQVIEAAGKQVPFPFLIPFDPARIDSRHTYAVRATITIDDKRVYTSTRQYPVITRESPRYGVEIEVEPVGP